MKSQAKIASLAIVVVIAALIVGIIASPNHKAPIKIIPKKAETSLSITTLVGSLKTKLEDQYSSLSTTPTDSTNDLGYPESGGKFNLILPIENNTSFSLADKSTSDESATYNYLAKTTSLISTYFKNNGFTTTENDQYFNYMSEEKFFENQHSLCQVTVYSLLDVTCDSKAQLNSLTNEAEPLVKVYLSEYSGVSPITISDPTINSSKTPGYRIATMNILSGSGQVKAYYYSLDNGVWQPVNSTWYNDPHEDGDIMPNCEDFESDLNVAKAFVGIICYDSSNKQISTIKA